MNSSKIAVTPVADERYRKVATELWHSDELEIDTDAAVSPTDSGAWVHAWVWVSNDEFHN